jgi:hypothetical protein
VESGKFKKIGVYKLANAHAIGVGFPIYLPIGLPEPHEK